MNLFFCWMAVHVSLCFGILQPTVRQKTVSFHIANQTSMAEAGSLISHVSKVKCTLICFERTSCTSVFYWKSEGKCGINSAQQAPAEHGGHDNAARQDPKVNRQDPNSEVTKQGRQRKVYYGLLRNTPRQEDSQKMPTQPVDENSQMKTRIKPEKYIYFKEIGFSLVHHLTNKSWREATRLCTKKGGIIFDIDNQTKQDAAERLVEFSGQELIFFGLYANFFMWNYFGSDADVRYTNWAPKEPHLPMVAALSRSSGYKWVTTDHSYTASSICAKLDK